MKIERTKNATRNIIYGFVLKLYQMIVPFFMRTAMIYLMGVQYLGLNSLFTSILQVLNLAELGVGAAMVYSMYKPIADDDPVTICALMKLYRIYYRVIGLIIAVVGGVLTPFVPKLISGDIPPDVNIYVLYLLNLGATVLSYWLFAYKNSILQAHQRTDIASKVLLTTSTFQYVLQLVILFVFKNYYYYVSVLLFSQVMTNVITALVASKLYPKYKPGGKIDENIVRQINRKIRDLFTAKIGAIIYDSADTIVISAFLGLTALAIYQNYFFIVTAITGVVSIFFSACTAGIGNSLVVETKEKNFRDFNKFTMIICWIAGVCSSCMLCIYQPFIELWVGRELMLSVSAVVFFVIYFFIRQLNALFNLYKDAAGMWHDDRFRPLVAALTNLVLNLILVQFMDLYGILLSTVVAIVFVGMPWLLHSLFTVLFHKEHMSKYVGKVLIYVLVVVFSCAVSYFVCSFINFGMIVTILIRALVCVCVPNFIFFIAFRKSEEFHDILILANQITKGNLYPVWRKMGLKL